MDFQTIANAISTIGFPILACVALYKQNIHMSDIVTKNTQAINELTAKIETNNSIATVVEENKEAIESLKEYIEGTTHHD